MSTVPVVDRFDAIQYDGTNKADVAAVIPNYIFVAETAAGLQFKSGSGTWFCPPNGWIVYSIRYNTVLEQWNTTAAFEIARRALVDGAALAGLQADMTAAQADIGTLQTDVSAAQGDITAAQADITALQSAVAALAAADAILAVGVDTFTFGPGVSTVSVDIQPAQSGTGYTAGADLFGGVTLGNLAITDVEPLDANTVNVTVNNSGLLALGASVLVAVTA